MNFYVTSDHHFYHKNIIKYCFRPFPYTDGGIFECNEHIIEKHNEIVQEDDIVLYLGDLDFGPLSSKVKLQKILQRLNGRKVLIKGNHDKHGDSFYWDFFEDVRSYIVCGSTFFCHYPCYEDTEFPVNKEKPLIKILKNTECKTVIHGHIHHNDPHLWVPDGYERVNVCVDYVPNNYYPIKITNPDLITRLSKMYK